MEVFDLPDARQDPVWLRSKGTDTGRDGCRVPLPWKANEPSYGFSPEGRSWLPSRTCGGTSLLISNKTMMLRRSRSTDERWRSGVANLLSDKA